jgi:hypothetical protein
MVPHQLRDHVPKEYIFALGMSYELIVASSCAEQEKNLILSRSMSP